MPSLIDDMSPVSQAALPKVGDHRRYECDEILGRLLGGASYQDLDRTAHAQELPYHVAELLRLLASSTRMRRPKLVMTTFGSELTTLGCEAWHCRIRYSISS